MRASFAGRRLWPLAVALAAGGAAAGTIVAVGRDATPRTAPPRPPASASPSPAASGTPAPAAEPHPVSLQALIARSYDGRDFRVGRVLARNDDYTRYYVTFRSGRLTISGIMNLPRGAGPYPVLILNHGYIDPEVYTNGRGLAREQDYLARHGYVVLHVDYRNHAQSDDDPRNDLRLRLGYTEDVINAVLAIRKAGLPSVDGERVGMLGRSMGGGVTLNAAVVRPDLIDAVVLYAPVSADAVDNFERWIARGDPGRRRLAGSIVAAYGSPQQNPSFWRNVSATSFFDRIDMPLMVHHGTADESVPYAWSQRTVSALLGLGKEVTFFTYPGEHHAFGPQWTSSIRRTAAFFDEHLRRSG